MFEEPERPLLGSKKTLMVVSFQLNFCNFRNFFFLNLCLYKR
jgi:hypothetical protein